MHNTDPNFDRDTLTDYIHSVRTQFEYYKWLGEQAIAQLSEDALFYQPNTDSNSIATIVKHLSGNMLSRWTDLFTTDGEKEWRNRDGEFENDLRSKSQLLQVWECGWATLFQALSELKIEDLGRDIYIRNEKHSVIQAINRQLAHYPYHVGQIVFIAKMLSDGNWKSLSIPRGNSDAYNTEKFGQTKQSKYSSDDSEGDSH